MFRWIGLKDENENNAGKIPEPPKLNSQVAEKVRSKKYFPQYFPEDLHTELSLYCKDKHEMKEKHRKLLSQVHEELFTLLEQNFKMQMGNLMGELHTELYETLLEKGNRKLLKIKLHGELYDEIERRELQKRIEEEMFRPQESFLGWDTEFHFAELEEVVVENPVVETPVLETNPLKVPMCFDDNSTVKETEADNKMLKREHPEGYLELVLGPMCSGKSSKILFKLSSMADQRFKCLYINTEKDVRGTESYDEFVTTHNSSYSKLSPKITCVKAKSLIDVDISNYDYIAIDEFQFFNTEDDVNCVIDWVSLYGKYVLVASLDGDFSRKKFGRVTELISHADDVTKVTAYCDNCRDNYGILKKAPFTARMTSEKTAELIGGRDIYRALCRSCHDFHLDVIISYF